MKVKTIVCLITWMGILFSLPGSVLAADTDLVLRADDIEITEIQFAEDGIRTVLEKYTEIVGELDAKTEDTPIFQERTGAICDYNGDGFPELILLYKAPGSYWDVELKFVRRTQQGVLSCYRQRFSSSGHGASSAVYLSHLEDESLLHFLFYTNEKGIDAVISFSDGAPSLFHTLQWDESLTQHETYYVDDVEDAEEFVRIYSKIDTLICVYRSESFPTLRELQYQILHYAEDTED